MNSGARRPVAMQAVDELTGAPQGRLDEAGGNGELDGPNSAPLPRIMHARNSSSSSSYGTAALSRLWHRHSPPRKLCTCTTECRRVQTTHALRGRASRSARATGARHARMPAASSARRTQTARSLYAAAPSHQPHPV